MKNQETPIKNKEKQGKRSAQQRPWRCLGVRASDLGDAPWCHHAYFSLLHPIAPYCSLLFLFLILLLEFLFLYYYYYC